MTIINIVITPTPIVVVPTVELLIHPLLLVMQYYLFIQINKLFYLVLINDTLHSFSTIQINY